MSRSIREHFDHANRKWAKYEPYFEVYDAVAGSLDSDDLVVEIGVANGGSAEAWAEYLDEHKRYVGVDLNPEIKILESELGIRCLVGDSTQVGTWGELSRIGKIGLVIDDGGHTNAQQLASLRYAPMVLRPGGWLVIEDMHASFMKSFGNPRPTRPSRVIATLVEDFCRYNAGKRPKYSTLWESYDMIKVAPSIVAFRLRRTDDVGEVSGGRDGSLMNHDWRWGSPTVFASPLRRLFVRLTPRLRDEVDARKILRQFR